MKISLLITNDISQDQRMHRIAKSCQQMGLEVELIGRRVENSQPLGKRTYKTTRLDLNFEKGPLFYLNYNYKAFIYLMKTKPDIVYAVDLDSLLASGTYKRMRMQTLLVFDAHEHFTEVPELQSQTLKKKLWEALGIWGISLSDLCLTVGPALADIFSKKYDRNFHAIRNVPQPDIFGALDYQPEQKIILYQGMLNKGRGLEAAIQAMVALPDWRLWIVGSGDIEEKLKKMAQQSAASKRIRFFGFVAPEELPALTRQATIGLNLLVAESLSYYYSLANKTFDYMNQGVPSVQMAFPEYLAINAEHNCFLILHELSVQALVTLIKNLDKEQLTALHKINLEASLKYQWPQESEKLNRLLGALITEKQQSY